MVVGIHSTVSQSHDCQGRKSHIPALVLQTAPATVGVPGPQTLTTVRVLLTVLHLHLAQPPVCHHVHVVTLQIKQQVGADTGPRGYGDVGVLYPTVGRLHHRLLEATLAGAEEDHGEVSGAGGRHAGQHTVEGEHGGLEDGQLSAQGSVDIQTTELLSNLGQLCVDTPQTENGNIS